MNNKDYLKKILSANIHVEDKEKLDESLNELLAKPFEEPSAPYQQLISDTNGKAVWVKQNTLPGGMAEYDGTKDKTNPNGSTGNGFTNNIVRYWKISDEIPSREQLWSDELVLEVKCNSGEYNKDINGEIDGGYFKGYSVMGSETIGVNIPLLLVIERPNVIISTSTVKFYFPETGLYSIIFSSKKEYVTSVKWPSIKLSDEYIPSTVPVIQSASVGQTVVVKAVDENGKPTAWEVIDPHTLTDTETGKKYQLSVVNGKLTMTEVE